MIEERGVFRFCVGIVVAIGYVVSLSGCDEAMPAPPEQEYSLEVINAASDRVRIHIAMMGGYWLHTVIAEASRHSPAPGPKVLELDVDGRTSIRVIRPGGAKDSAEDAVHVRELRSVRFLDTYRGYEYLGFGCGVDLAVCEDSVDDTLVYHRSADGTLERLFVESPDRPFYLERDRENRDLARLVITYVPTPPEPVSAGSSGR